MLDRLPRWPPHYKWSFRYRVGEREQRRRHRKPDRLRRLETDRQLELGLIFYRQVAGIFPFEDAIDIGAGTAKYVGWIDADDINSPWVVEISSG